MYRRKSALLLVVLFLVLAATGCGSESSAPEKPNIIIIYADDLGYGDVSSYGATEVETPNIDRLAADGIRFTNAHSPAATCTPSRFSLLTGEYAWRKEGTGIAGGNDPLVIDPGRTTLPSLLQQAGYTTGVIGKWHLGLGGEGGPNWNGEIKPGPREVGFDYSYLIPATGDRVPTVYVKNGRVVNLDPNDPIKVSYGEPIGDEPTGEENPELLKMHPSHGHDDTIINGISRIGYMSGGHSARWNDSTMADVITGEALEFIEKHSQDRFFLFYSTHDIHVPRVPHPRFAGESGLGPRGDEILELDASVGKIMDKLSESGLTERTLVIFTSDNGPVLDDGYQDQAVEKLNGHEPAGPFRGGKYSAFEGGTRVPFIVYWPGAVDEGTTSDALISQVDLLSSFAALTDQEMAEGDGPDSFNLLSTILGESTEGRGHLVEQSASGTLSLIRGSWKYIEPSDGPRINRRTNIELGNNPQPQLYNLAEDPGEQRNVADKYPDRVQKLSNQLQALKGNGRSRPESK